MADRIIILCTTWAEDYWESPEEAPYPRRRYTELPDWDNLAQSCPLPGLGIYIKQKDRDYTHRNFVFLRIDGMRFDRENKQPCFSFTPIVGVSTLPSRTFIEQFPYGSIRLFSALKADDVLKALRAIGVNPPEEWLRLIEEVRPITSWRDYIGKKFLELIDKELSNSEFEDRCFALLKALGFNVKQWGHTLIGEYPDGEIFLDDDIVIVYDCKNVESFNPSTDDRRKLSDYVDNAKIRYPKKEIYGIFIVKSFEEERTGDFFFPISTLVYLLYKKMILGKEFDLLPFRNIFTKRISLNQTLIDNEWRT